MDVPTHLFLNAIQNRNIYYFSSNRINTNIPHYYVCVNRTNDDLILMTICTSQFDTICRFIESRGLPLETLVYISTGNDNHPFDKQTFINCNEIFIYTLDEFKSMHQKGSVVYEGQISESYY